MNCCTVLPLLNLAKGIQIQETLEAPGGCYHNCKHYSVPMSQDKLDKATDKYGLDLTQVYKMSRKWIISGP